MRMMITSFQKSFHQWLSEQPLERQREIRKAERAYVESRRVEYAADGFTANPTERAFMESMEGWAEQPAGRTSPEQELFDSLDTVAYF